MTKESERRDHARWKSGWKGAWDKERKRIERVAEGDKSEGLNWYNLSRARLANRS